MEATLTLLTASTKISSKENCSRKSDFACVPHVSRREFSVQKGDATEFNEKKKRGRGGRF